MPTLASIRAALPIVAALTATAALAGLAVAGWVTHGESIFLSLANEGWLTCF